MIFLIGTTLTSIDKRKFRKEFYRAEFSGVVSSIEMGDRGSKFYSLRDTVVGLNKVSFNETVDIQVNDSIVKLKEKMTVIVFRKKLGQYFLNQELEFSY